VLTRANTLRRRGIPLVLLPNRQPAPNRTRFIEIWQSSATLAEAAQRLNMSRKVAIEMAYQFRASGAPLKRFR
jgi:hypothetical protein